MSARSSLSPARAAIVRAVAPAGAVAAVGEELAASRPTVRVAAVDGATVVETAGVVNERSTRGTVAAPTLDPSPEDDAALVARMRLRDGQAFRVLVGRHLPALLGIGRRMLRDDAEAEDVAQEALIKLWQAGSALELGPGGAKPWLRRVVSNLCIDRIRSRRRTDVTDEVPEQEVDPDQLTGLVEGDLAGRVGQALRALPERQRQALTLFHYEGLSQVEVGEILGVSDEAVESLLSRARRTLRGALKDDWRQLLPDEA